MRLLASPSGYLLLLGLALTVIAKAKVLAGLDGVGFVPLVLVGAVASDVLLFVGLAAVSSLGEGRVRWLSAATIPLALMLLVLSLINYTYLGETGEQITYEAISLGLDRFGDLKKIVAELLVNIGVIKIIFVALALVGLPIAGHWLVRRQAPTVEPLVVGRHRALCAAWLLVPALLVWLLAPAPDAFGARKLQTNAALDTYWDWVTGTDPTTELAQNVEFSGYDPVGLVDERALRAFAANSRPNVLVIMLESARFDFTSLSGPSARAATPNLLALAQTGMWARTARAVVPHTTKSVFSMMCGRYPLMQRTTVEISEPLAIDCLPRMLRRAGYQTAFFQTALGTFEHRPRLVQKLGFAHFEAWENIGGEPLGYLASDDESLSAPLARWLDARDTTAPFMAALLTSATHHPYRLSNRVKARVKASGAPAGTAEQRYARLTEAEDVMLGKVLALLDVRDLRRSTIVVVVGDHGEGFGAKGVRQHDANFFEEGLRVPLVISGPGVPTRIIEGNASLVDLTPTLLALLGIPMSARGARATPGQSLLRDVPADTPRYFGCWYDLRCRGFVVNHKKVVFVPHTGQAFYFDLAADPNERRALPLTPALVARMPVLHQVIESRRTRTFPLIAGEVSGYGEWKCERGARCKHPRSPTGLFFESP